MSEMAAKTMTTASNVAEIRDDAKSELATGWRSGIPERILAAEAAQLGLIIADRVGTLSLRESDCISKEEATRHKRV